MGRKLRNTHLGDDARQRALRNWLPFDRPPFSPPHWEVIELAGEMIDGAHDQTNSLTGLTRRIWSSRLRALNITARQSATSEPSSAVVLPTAKERDDRS